MAAEFRVELLAVRQLDDHALERLVIHLLTGLVEHADAPGHRFLALELVRQHAEWAGLPFQRMADHVGFEKQSLGVLRAGGLG
jgi:hypothetical protein